MTSYMVDHIKDGKYVVGTRFKIPLTENKLHDFIWYIGEGYFSIGVKGIDKDYIKAWVDKDDIINWSVLDECDKDFPGVHAYKWPRFINYTGNDTSFVNWSQTRRIESFTWRPLKPMEVDFSQSAIYSLYIYSDYKLTLNIGNKIKHLSLYGNPDNFVIDKCSRVPSLDFYSKKDKESKVYNFPIYPCFRDATRIKIEVDPNGDPFDCSCLLQFPNLELLYLLGNMTNLHVLKNLNNIKQLGFWNVPDLSNLPTLDNWSNLDDFVAMNIDENVGVRLKSEVKEMKRTKKIGFASVTKLRNKLWFETEYCAPFVHWQEPNRKKASKEFKKCLKKVKDAQFVDDIKDAIIEFINKMNCLENIESVERDDIYSALHIIMQNSTIEVDVSKWGEWFDETRDF